MVYLLTRKKYYVHDDEMKKNRNFANAKIKKSLELSTLLFFICYIMLVGVNDITIVPNITNDNNNFVDYDKIKRKYQ